MPEPTLKNFRDLIKIYETALEELLLDHQTYHLQFTQKYRTLTRYLRTVRDKAIRPLLKDEPDEPELVHQHT